MIAPAVIAAGFAFVAAAPTVFDHRRVGGLRVEQVVGVGPTALIRVTDEDGERGLRRAPTALELEVTDRSGARVSSARTVASARTWVTTALPLRGRGPFTLNVKALGGTETVVTALGAWQELQFERDTGSVRAAEATLIPGREAEVLVRAPEADTVSVASVMDIVAIAPERSAVDLCGVASVRVRVDGLGAPVTVIAHTRTNTERFDLRLPVTAGGVSLSREGSSAVLHGTDPGEAWAITGDAHGATAWSYVSLVGAPGDTVAHEALSEGALWVIGARSHDLSDAVSLSVTDNGTPTGMPTTGCDSTAMQRWIAAGNGSPALTVVTVFDGAARALTARRKSAETVRRWALTGVALCVLFLIVLVAIAGARRPRESLRAVDSSGVSRAVVVVTSAVILASLGLVLAYTVFNSGR